MHKTFDKALAICLGCIGAYFIFTTIRGIHHLYSPLPFSDQWGGYVGFMHKLADGHYRAWWDQHMEHRIVLVRALQWIDAKVFGGRNVFLLTFGALLQFATVVLFVWQAKRHRSPVHPLAVAGIALVFLFSWIQQENFAWGFQSQFFAIYLFALLAFAFHPPEFSWLLSIACGIAATLSMGNGVFVFLVLAIQSFLLRQGLRQIVLPIAVGAVVAAIYFYGFHKPEVVFPEVAPGEALKRIPEFVMLFMGNALAARGLPIVAGMVVGLCSIVLVTVITWRLYVKEGITRYRAFLIGGYIMILGSACGAAAGRYKLGVGQAIVSRYDTPAFIAWTCVALLLLDIAQHAPTRRVLQTVYIAIALWLLPFQFNTKADTQMQFDRDLDTLSLKIGVDDPEYSGLIYPIAARPALRADVKWAVNTEFGPFASGWLHDVGLVRFSPDQVDNDVCTGYLDEIKTNASNVSATGWVVTKRERDEPVLILMVDAAGNTVGYGVSGSIRYDVRNAMHANLHSGWAGLAPAGVHPVKAYAYELHKFCELTNGPAVRAMLQ
ncbi:hypothetical protein [Paraburkholderia sp. SIMBA_027]|uniref:hypothetical protein n=1 Tax=Paraburkholderia sp. SIMBA_027 TaxID=3085770 RepID=UPI0039783C35